MRATVPPSLSKQAEKFGFHCVQKGGSLNLCSGCHYFTVSYRRDSWIVLSTVSPFLFWKCPISQYSHLHTVVMHWFYFLSPLILHTRSQGRRQSSPLHNHAANSAIIRNTKKIVIFCIFNLICKKIPRSVLHNRERVSKNLDPIRPTKIH